MICKEVDPMDEVIPKDMREGMKSLPFYASFDDIEGMGFLDLLDEGSVPVYSVFLMMGLGGSKPFDIHNFVNDGGASIKEFIKSDRDLEDGEYQGMMLKVCQSANSNPEIMEEWFQKAKEEAREKQRRVISEA